MFHFTTIRRAGVLLGILEMALGCSIDSRQLVVTTNQGGSIGSTGGNGVVGGAGGSANGDTGGNATGGNATGGNANGGSANGGAPPTPCEPIVAHPGAALIDDFEDDNNQVAVVDGRLGFWFAYNDGTGTQVPAPNTDVVPESPGANGSEFALHTTGTNFTNWGAGVGTELNTSAVRVCTVDLSAYHGIQFVAKGGPGTATVHVQVTQVNLQSVEFGGSCDPSVDNCSDFYQFLFQPTPNWTHYSVPFTDLQQEGWGTQRPFDLRQIQGLRIQVTAPDFDLWLDDIALLP